MNYPKFDLSPLRGSDSESINVGTHEYITNVSQLADLIFEEQLPRNDILSVVRTILSPNAFGVIKQSTPSFYLRSEIENQYKKNDLKTINVDLEDYTLQVPIPASQKGIHLKDIDFYGEFAFHLHNTINQKIIEKFKTHVPLDPAVKIQYYDALAMKNLKNDATKKAESLTLYLTGIMNGIRAIYNKEAVWIITNHFMQVITLIYGAVSTHKHLINHHDQILLGRKFIVIDDTKREEEDLEAGKEPFLLAFGYFKECSHLFIGRKKGSSPDIRPINYATDGLFFHLSIGYNLNSKSASFVVLKTKMVKFTEENKDDYKAYVDDNQFANYLLGQFNKVVGEA